MNQTTAPRVKDSSAACPQCGARRAPDVAWCTQCFTVLDTPSATDPTAHAGQPGGHAAGADAAVHVPTQVTPDDLSAWDLAQREAAELPQEERDARLNIALSELEASQGQQQGRMGRLGGLGSTVTGKIVIAVVGGICLFGVVYGLMALVGAFL